jgi:hypothetical protein
MVMVVMLIVTLNLDGTASLVQMIGMMSDGIGIITLQL